MRGWILLLLLAVILAAGACGSSPARGTVSSPPPAGSPADVSEKLATKAVPSAISTINVVVPTASPAGSATAPPTAVPIPASAPEEPPVDAALGDTWVRPVDAAKMVYVPAGAFEMGSDDPFYNNENPPHVVQLEDFWIDRTEVTNAQYRLCEEVGVCKPPREAGSVTRDIYYGDAAHDAYPVIWVSWYRAVAYCKWVGGRLPTEEEWEYAARGPEARWYPWGDRPDGTRLNYCDANGPLDHADENANDGYADTAPVGSYTQGASWCGALDMVGNVWEWVWDWYGFYPSEANPSWLASDMEDRVLRGGSWDTDGDHARCTFRNWLDPAKSHDSVGFRCVVSAFPPGSD
jgi:formylglycine-generating enzyme required for sulfatase activity